VRGWALVGPKLAGNVEESGTARRTGTRMPYFAGFFGFVRQRTYFPVVAFCKNSTSALRSSDEPIVCSGILVPGV